MSRALTLQRGSEKGSLMLLQCRLILMHDSRTVQQYEAEKGTAAMSLHNNAAIRGCLCMLPRHTRHSYKPVQTRHKLSLLRLRSRMPPARSNV